MPSEFSNPPAKKPICQQPGASAASRVEDLLARMTLEETSSSAADLQKVILTMTK